MLEKDFDGLNYCNEETAMVTKTLFNNSTYIHGLAFSNIDYVVYPASPDLTTRINDKPDTLTLAFEEIVEVTNVHGTLADLIDDQYITVNGTFPLIKIVTIDNSYVLSHEFYTNAGNLSILEMLTRDYLNMVTIDLDMLLALCSKCKTWGRLEQFYYIPILLTLIKEADRGTYS
jgi:hypothetical protein